MALRLQLVVLIHGQNTCSPGGQKKLEMHTWAGGREQCGWAQLDGGAGRAAGPVRGMAGLAAGRAAGWIGQGRWGWVGWVDRPGRTGTQVVHPSAFGQLRG